MKQCNLCLNWFEENTDNFYKRKSGKFDPQCRGCLSNRSKKYYSLNKKECINRTSKKRNQRISKNRKYIFEFLKDKRCVDCGETNILTLEFDHVDPSLKKYSVSWIMCQGLSLDKLKEEVNKCEIRCANCHKIRTAKQQNWYRYFYSKESSNK